MAELLDLSSGSGLEPGRIHHRRTVQRRAFQIRPTGIGVRTSNPSRPPAHPTCCTSCGTTSAFLRSIRLADRGLRYTQWDLEATSISYSFDDADAETRKDTQLSSMLGSCGIYRKGWKANTVHPTIADWSNFSADEWALYHVDEDRSENHNLAAAHPEKVEQLKALWYHEAGKYQGFPLEDRGPVEVLTTPRPQLAPQRDRYVYRPNTAEVTVHTDGAQGVLFSHGGRFGGHALFVEDSRLHDVYNWLGELEQEIVSDVDIPSGNVIRGVSFDKEGHDEQRSATGTATLFVNDEQVGQQSIKTQPGKLMLAGEGLNVGKDPGGPVSTTAYTAPFAFTGGAIREVIIDVSGLAYVDLELDAIGMMSRD